jgi:anaerobic magnesium-protoporphyrin IX monomethyl ester cyclase
MILLKVLLIVPRYWTGKKTPLGRLDLSTIPLGLCYISAVLEKNGFPTTILDMNPTDMQSEELEDRLNHTSPDIVGISTMTSNFQNSVKVAKIAKKWNTRCKVVMGGVHATFKHREILEDIREVDVVVRYEGEYTMNDLARVLEEDGSLRDVKGISFREGDKLITTPTRERIDNLDELPYPAHHLLVPPVEGYIGRYGPRNFPVITTRGCPFGCIYCSTMALHGRKYRTRSVDNVTGELELLLEKFKINNISFVDDNFTMQNERVLKLCDSIKKRNLPIEWGCSARVDQVSEALLKAMKQAGCTDIFFGIESATQNVLDLVQKGFRIEQAKDAVRTAEKLGIRTHCSFILGLPGETVKSLRNIVDFVDETKPTGRVLPNRLSILPGSELAERTEEFFINQSLIPEAEITKAQLEIFSVFFKKSFGVNKLFRVKPPNITIK